MKLHEVQQGSEAWHYLRCRIPTASEFDNIVTPHWKIRTGEMPRKYLASKLAASWQGHPLPQVSTYTTDEGKAMEGQARAWFELEHAPVKQVGFVTTDDERIGCSPDGLIGDDNGLELKCPGAHTHVAYLLSGQVPDQYAAQVHGSMFVTGRQKWTFLSYHSGFPALVVNVVRDEAIMEVLEKALTTFVGEFDDCWQRLVMFNGGPPPEKPKRKLLTRRLTWNGDEESDEVVP